MRPPGYLNIGLSTLSVSRQTSIDSALMLVTILFYLVKMAFTILKL